MRCTPGLPSSRRDLRITAIRDLTSTAGSPKGWDSEQPDGVPLLPVSSSSQMITFKVTCCGVTGGVDPLLLHLPARNLLSSQTPSLRRCGGVARSPSSRCTARSAGWMQSRRGVRLTARGASSLRRCCSLRRVACGGRRGWRCSHRSEELGDISMIPVKRFSCFRISQFVLPALDESIAKLRS